MKVLTVVRNVAILISEPVCERELPFTGMPEHMHISDTSISEMEIFRITPGV